MSAIDILPSVLKPFETLNLSVVRSHRNCHFILEYMSKKKKLHVYMTLNFSRLSCMVDRIDLAYQLGAVGDRVKKKRERAKRTEDSPMACREPG